MPFDADARGAISRLERRVALAREYRELLATELQRRPYHAIPVRELMDLAGIARASFYAYFLDKDDLLVALFELIHEDSASLKPAWFELPPGASEAEIHEAVARFAAFYVDNQLLIETFADAFGYAPGVAQIYRKALAARSERMAEYIAAVAPDLDATATAQAFAVLETQGVVEAARSDGEDGLGRFVDAAATLIWRSLSRAAV